MNSQPFTTTVSDSERTPDNFLTNHRRRANGYTALPRVSSFVSLGVPRQYPLRGILHFSLEVSPSTGNSGTRQDRPTSKDVQTRPRINTVAAPSVRDSNVHSSTAWNANVRSQSPQESTQIISSISTTVTPFVFEPQRGNSTSSSDDSRTVALPGRSVRGHAADARTCTAIAICIDVANLLGIRFGGIEEALESEL